MSPVHEKRLVGDSGVSWESAAAIFAKIKNVQAPNSPC